MSSEWSTTTASFTVTTTKDRWLMLRHERLGLTSWELPGGHVDPGESMETAAARETLEETGVSVRVGSLLAVCVHEWRERAERKVIAFFAAEASGGRPQAPAEEPAIDRVEWIDPLALPSTEVSAFLHPLVDGHRNGWDEAPFTFWMTHHRTPEGLWAPTPMAGPTSR